VKREIAVCSELKHGNIVPFIGVCHDDNEPPCLLSVYMKNGMYCLPFSSVSLKVFL
jgi:serine/threonine protein kinase